MSAITHCLFCKIKLNYNVYNPLDIRYTKTHESCPYNLRTDNNFVAFSYNSMDFYLNFKDMLLRHMSGDNYTEIKFDDLNDFENKLKLYLTFL